MTLRSRKPPSFLARNKRALVALAVLCLLVLTGEYFGGRLAHRIVAQKLPEVEKIYAAEQARFPQYGVSVFKWWTGTVDPEGTTTNTVSYVITLSSRSAIPDSDLTIAGKTACKAALSSSTPVRVTGRRQWFFLPIYTANTQIGRCS
jgi:hypothetical protein